MPKMRSRLARIEPRREACTIRISPYACVSGLLVTRLPRLVGSEAVVSPA